MRPSLSMRPYLFASAALAASLCLASSAFAASAGARPPVTNRLGGAGLNSGVGAAPGGGALTPPGQNLPSTGMNSLNSTVTAPRGGCAVGASAVPSC